MNRAALLMSAALLALWASTSQAQVKLEHKDKEGSKSRSETTSNVHQILTINGMDIETEVEQTVTTLRSVGKRREDGSLPIDSKIEAIRANMNLPGGLNIAYDSAAPPADKPDNPTVALITDLFQALVGVQFTIVRDKDDKVVAVEGAQDALDKLKAKNPLAADLVKNRVDPDMIKQATQQEDDKFPNILVRPGEPWVRTEVMNLGQGQTLTFEKQYEYLGTVEKNGKTLDKIGVKAKSVTFAKEDDGSPVKIGKSDLKVESSEGTILFDREAGQPVESKDKFRIKGDLAMTINGTDLKAELDLTIENNTITQPE